MPEYRTVTHDFAPVYNENSRILILGSFPSVKSREQHFFYGHPQNRFWKILAAVCETQVPQTVPEKKAFLLEQRIALWDVIARCEIIGSSDASIRNVQPTDLDIILNTALIERIFCNGNKAYQLFNKYQKNSCGQAAYLLPSSSPANASWSLERLTEVWGAALREISRKA